MPSITDPNDPPPYTESPTVDPNYGYNQSNVVYAQSVYAMSPNPVVTKLLILSYNPLFLLYSILSGPILHSSSICLIYWDLYVVKTKSIFYQEVRNIVILYAKTTYQWHLERWDWMDFLFLRIKLNRELHFQFILLTL